ncbi:MAG: hypothetical protein H6695_03350 [Deferribacteres bacterium]|nr:hypothetical protein [candidate division KSB1 bacterium]MCB9509184.1 hypothetical protein [Deferribacteres bacterium]
MQNGNNEVVNAVVSILTFPHYLQAPLLAYAWAASDPFWIMSAKRLFLLLPVLAFIIACWLTIACVVSIIVRGNRSAFVNAMFITWLDLGKSFVAFWGGIFRFVFHLAVVMLELVKIVLVSIWAVVLEFIAMPFRLLGNAGHNLMYSNVPWLAVIMTLLWCVVETAIFTYVTTPLVMDTFANITGEYFTEAFLRIPLFVFLFIVVLGSYAVLATMVEAIKSKDVGSIIGVTVIELVVLSVEVVFLYREFVDSLVPWLAQHSENFELGIWGTLVISTVVWFGIRSMSWFLFASHGTPTILSIIRGRGTGTVETRDRAPQQPRPARSQSSFLAQVKEDMAWFERQGEALLGSFILPPLQIFAAVVNFCTLLISSRHLFEIPFKSIRDIKNAATLLSNGEHAEHVEERPQTNARQPRREERFSMVESELYQR